MLIDNATEHSIAVTWKTPECSDNSGNVPQMRSIRQAGALFTVPGSYEVLYTVSDGTNENKNCSFRITLKSEYLLTDISSLKVLTGDYS